MSSPKVLFDDAALKFQGEGQAAIVEGESSGRRAKRLMVSHCATWAVSAFYFRFDQRAHGGLGRPFPYWRRTEPWLKQSQDWWTISATTNRR